jgi:hypothetical protein
MSFSSEEDSQFLVGCDSFAHSGSVDFSHPVYGGNKLLFMVWDVSI